jgi:hypothetical protein
VSDPADTPSRPIGLVNGREVGAGNRPGTTDSVQAWSQRTHPISHRVTPPSPPKRMGIHRQGIMRGLSNSIRKEGGGQPVQRLNEDILQRPVDRAQYCTVGIQCAVTRHKGRRNSGFPKRSWVGSCFAGLCAGSRPHRAPLFASPFARLNGAPLIPFCELRSLSFTVAPPLT